MRAAFDRGSAALTILRAGKSRTITIVPTRGCASDVQLIPSTTIDSWADGGYVSITTALLAFTRSDDELAIVIGHEMAHNILGHPARLDAEKVDRGLLRILPRNAAKIRTTERQADYVGLYLVALAGYDIHRAPDFWRRFGKEYGVGIFGDGTHPGATARAKAAEQEITDIERKRAANLPLAPDMPPWKGQLRQMAGPPAE